MNTSAFGQLPPPAAPIAEIEIKQNSIRSRSRALEQFRQDAKKSSKTSPVVATENYKQLRQDFADVQLLQNDIVKIYTTQKTINYSMLESKSKKMIQSAKRLHRFLFPDIEKRFWEDSKPEDEATTNLPNSIVKVDNALGRFISNPMFKERTVLKLDESEKARRELEIMIRYSERVSKLSKELESKK